MLTQTRQSLDRILAAEDAGGADGAHGADHDG